MLKVQRRVKKKMKLRGTHPTSSQKHAVAGEVAEGEGRTSPLILVVSAGPT